MDQGTFGLSWFGFTGCMRTGFLSMLQPQLLASQGRRLSVLNLGPATTFTPRCCTAQNNLQNITATKKLADIRVFVTSLYYPEHLEPSQQSSDNLLTMQTLQTSYKQLCRQRPQSEILTYGAIEEWWFYMKKWHRYFCLYSQISLWPLSNFLRMVHNHLLTPGNPITSSGFHGHQAHMVYIHICWQKT